MYITVKFRFTDDNILDIIETAGYGIGYWASDAVVDENAKTYTVTNGEEELTKTLSYNDIREAISKLLNGKAKVGSHITSAMMSFGIDAETPDIGNYDSDVCDCIIQVAMFDEVIYG